MKKPIIIKTFIHLTDRKGWEHTEEYPGNFPLLRTYRVPKSVRWLDDPIPLDDEGLVPLGMPPSCYEFELVDDDEEHIFDNYYFKHLYFEEK